MKFYDFVDRAPTIAKLVVIEGTDRTLAESAVERILDQVVPAESRDLNLARVSGEQLDDMSRIEEAVQTMPFLAESRCVVIGEAHRLRVAQRRELWRIAQEVPAGNVLVLCDLFPPAKKTAPQPFGQLAGRTALRIDVTANESVRQRYIEELLEELGVTAEPRAVAVLARTQAELASVRNDLQKIALTSKRVTLAELERESLSIEDPKAYRYASALVEGRLAEAFSIAAEFFANDPRGGAIPLLYNLAIEYGLLWELARPGGSLPPRAKWRERILRPIAARLGEPRARASYERAVRGFEAIVTGKNDEPRLLVERLTAELGGLR